MEELIAPTCDQANELIAFLYGELDTDESRAFNLHLHACSSCSKELGAFSNIRGSMVAWRDESLGAVSSVVTRYAAAGRANQTNPSALAALREFFNLSPLWLKGAVAFATILFCLFAGLAVARLRSDKPVLMANNSAGPYSIVVSDQQLNALVERRVQDELLRLKNSTAQLPAPRVATDHSSNSVGVHRSARRANEAVTNSPARRPLSKTEREQLAADLRLVAVNNEGELDLLDDRINQ